MLEKYLNPTFKNCLVVWMVGEQCAVHVAPLSLHPLFIHYYFESFTGGCWLVVRECQEKHLGTAVQHS